MNGADKLAVMMIGRSVFAETALKTEADSGTRQYVILGAGYDTFIYRRMDWARDISVFLIDGKERIDAGRKRAEAAGLKVRREYIEIPADLSAPGWIDQLTGHPAFCGNKRTFVNMMGLSLHMGYNGMEELIKALGDAIPTGSAIAFDYVSRESSWQKGTERTQGQEEYACSPVEQMLSRCGFRLYEDAAPEEMDRRFFEAYNRAFEGRKIYSMEGVNCCLAVRKRRK